MIGDTRPVIRVVQGDRHPIHCNDFKPLPFKLKLALDALRQGQAIMSPLASVKYPSRDIAL